MAAPFIVDKYLKNIVNLIFVDGSPISVFLRDFPQNLLLNKLSAPGSTREISDFVREVASAEDAFARSLCRLGKQEKSNVTHILLSPIWRVLKVSLIDLANYWILQSCVEKTGAAHLELASKLNELSKDIRRYADEDLKVTPKVAFFLYWRIIRVRTVAKIQKVEFFSKLPIELKFSGVLGDGLNLTNPWRKKILNLCAPKWRKTYLVIFNGKMSA